MARLSNMQFNLCKKNKDIKIMIMIPLMIINVVCCVGRAEIQIEI